MPNKRTWTKRVRNVEIEGEIARIPLSNGLYAIIDAADVAIVEGWNWSFVNGYAERGVSIGGGKSATLKLHNAIMGMEGKDDLIDHRDRDPLNCRRGNLRPATNSQNGQNRRIASNNTTGFKGVSRRGDRGTFLAYIQSDGVKRKIGTFKTAEAAARGRDAEAIRLHGEFAVLNFDKEQTP